MCTECLFKYLFRFGATWMMPKRGLRGAFLGTDSCKSFGVFGGTNKLLL